MKYSPTVTLALVLAAGIAGAAAAQTAATPGTASTTAQPQANYAQPQSHEAQAPPKHAEPQSNYSQTNPMPPAGAGMPGATTQRLSAPGRAGLQNFAPDQVRSAQEQLQAAGLYKGPTDGLMDPDTRAAIANFQQQNGLRRSATLDRPTLDRLMAGRTSGSGSGMPGAPAMAPKGDQGATPAPAGAGGHTEAPTDR
jgi:hypothetical protein